MWAPDFFDLRCSRLCSARQPRMSPTLESLPDDVILEIFECLYAPTSKYLPLNSAQFQIFGPPSRLSRRLRPLALRFLWRDVFCQTGNEMERVTEIIYGDVSSEDHGGVLDGKRALGTRARFIRCVVCGQPTSGRVPVLTVARSICIGRP